MTSTDEPKKNVNILSLGGNELLSPGNHAMNVLDQFGQTRFTGEQIKKVVEARPEDYFVLVHGNGPQVGRIQEAFDIASETGKVMPQPYYIGGAQSQGEIGFVIQQSFHRAGVPREVIPLVTQVVVDRNDPAFANPTKFVGRTFTLDELTKLYSDRLSPVSEREYHVCDSSQNTLAIYKEKEGFYRKVVASPRPLEIMGVDAATILMAYGFIPIIAGGGGIPVIRKEDGTYKGIEAVVDKDLTSAKLAEKMVSHYATEEGERRDVTLTIVTAVPGVYIDFNTPDQRFMPEIRKEEAMHLLQQGQFPPGSMGPKVAAAINAIEAGVPKVIITDSENLLAALDGKAGTVIYR